MCHDYYVESINENGTVEAAAHLLWLYVWVDVIWNNRNLAEGVSKLYDKKIDKRFFYQNYILKSFCENEDEAYTIGDGCYIDNNELKQLEKYVEREEEVYALLFGYLRKTADGCEYADYYMALQYILNLVDNDYDMAMNQAIGWEMMRKFAFMENKYVINLIMADYWE